MAKKKLLDDKMILASAGLGFMVITTTLLQFYIPAMILAWCTTVLPLLFLAIGYRVYRRGYRPARFYIISWTLMFLGTATYGMLSIGAISYSLPVEMLGPFGAWFEAAFLSFALADRIKLLQKERQEAQSKLIQAQIEPHFLFNTLANISSLAETNVKKAKRMLQELGTYLRTTLIRTREGETILKQEVELLEAYLAIVKIRMGNRLAYKIDIPESLNFVCLPPLLLQPLVENSIRHGLEPKREGEGRLAVTGKIADGKLILEVIDNGVGMSDDWVSGIGLNNVYQRIKMLYGRKGKLAIMENSGGGVICQLTIPVNQDNIFPRQT